MGATVRRGSRNGACRDRARSNGFRNGMSRQRARSEPMADRATLAARTPAPNDAVSRISTVTLYNRIRRPLTQKIPIRKNRLSTESDRIVTIVRVKRAVSTPSRGETRVRRNHPSPARGEIIKPGVFNAGAETRVRPNHSEPRKGRDHKARRVNAGGRHASAPNHPSPARGEIIRPGVQTPGGRTRPRQTIRAPQGATIIKPGVQTPGRDTRPPKPSEPRKGRHNKARRVNAGEATRVRPNHPSPARGRS